MKKSYLVMAAAAALFAACSSNDLAEEKQSPQITQQTDELAVGFDAYVNRGTTRAGAAGTLTTAGTSGDIKNQSLQTTGFGVFSYYCDGEPYSENSKPDFMYNQKVSGADWSYSPIKYWPNEFGSEAISEGTDRLTFFAYAPYVNVDLTTGIAQAGAGEEATTGIIALTRNTTHGDPFVKYYADFNPEKRVDLCWGVAKNNFTSSVTGTANNVVAGKPYIDVVKPKISDKINFDFKHALAALNVTIDADVDLGGHGTNALDGRTKIWVRSITFEGFTDKGMLNLNGSATTSPYTPEWYDLSGNNKIGSGGKTTVYDGLRDGSEPLGEASNETPAALNPQIIQSYPYGATPYTSLVTSPTSLTGVPADAPINLFNSTTASEPIYVIPTNDDLKVTIVYDVETSDEHLTNYLSDGAVRGSSVANKITKEIQIGGSRIKLEAGKLYTVALHLGMTSVKFDASVSEWGTGTADPTWLPVNGGAFAAGVANSITVPAEAKTGLKFTISGLTGTALTAAAGSTVVSGTPSCSAIVSQSSEVTFSTTANTTVNKKTENIAFTETGGSASTTTITFNQDAAPLKLINTGIDATGKIITLGSTGTVSANADWADDAKTHWTVVKTAYDGSKTTLTKVASATAANQYVIAGTATNAATLTLYDAAKVGDVYTITCQAGDAEAETTVVKIGGIMFVSPVTAVAKGAKVTNSVVKVGSGTVTYASGTIANATVDAYGTVTGELNTGTSVITATLSPSGTDFSYPTAAVTANYTINLADIAVGGTLSITKAVASDATFTVCGLTTGSGVVITPEATWLSGLSMTAPDANGMTTVTYSATANSGAARTATVNINGKQIYITQASGL